MKEVCLVWMASGSYDSYSNEVILAYETLEEGEAAIAAIKEELKAMWLIPEPSDVFRKATPEERRDGFLDRIKNEYATALRAIAKVWPLDYSDHNGVTYVSIPDENDHKRGELDFSASMIPLSQLPKTG